MYRSTHAASFRALYLFGGSSYCVSLKSHVNLKVKCYISLVLNQKLNVSFGNTSKYFGFNDWSFLAFLFVKASLRISFLLLPPSFLLLSGESQLLQTVDKRESSMKWEHSSFPFLPCCDRKTMESQQTCRARKRNGPLRNVRFHTLAGVLSSHTFLPHEIHHCV